MDNKEKFEQIANKYATDRYRIKNDDWCTIREAVLYGLNWQSQQSTPEVNTEDAESILIKAGWDDYKLNGKSFKTIALDAINLALSNDRYSKLVGAIETQQKDIQNFFDANPPKAQKSVYRYALKVLTNLLKETE